jgi:hypothetical protein
MEKVSRCPICGSKLPEPQDAATAMCDACRKSEQAPGPHDLAKVVPVHKWVVTARKHVAGGDAAVECNTKDEAEGVVKMWQEAGLEDCTIFRLEPVQVWP